eukprot:5693790-Pyramimonas_sp.AAC.1
MARQQQLGGHRGRGCIPTPAGRADIAAEFGDHETEAAARRTRHSRDRSPRRPDGFEMVGGA